MTIFHWGNKRIRTSNQIVPFSIRQQKMFRYKLDSIECMYIYICCMRVYVCIMCVCVCMCGCVCVRFTYRTKHIFDNREKIVLLLFASVLYCARCWKLRERERESRSFHKNPNPNPNSTVRRAWLKNDRIATNLTLNQDHVVHQASSPYCRPKEEAGKLKRTTRYK
jgi:hypothetical protein